MTETGVRATRKLQTRQTLLDAALVLLEQQSLSSLGLREVTRAAGIAPAAFYRHFADTRELGVALVHEALASLHAMVADIRGQGVATDEVIARTVDVIAGYVRDRRAHLRFLARERHGGVAVVREAIAAELDLFADELAADLATRPESSGWSEPDLRMLAGLYVDQAMLTATALLEVEPEDTAALDRTIETARAHLRIITLGRMHWLDDEPAAHADAVASADPAQDRR